LWQIGQLVGHHLPVSSLSPVENHALEDDLNCGCLMVVVVGVVLLHVLVTMAIPSIIALVMVLVIVIASVVILLMVVALIAVDIDFEIFFSHFY
jgi:hypothetical protein